MTQSETLCSLIKCDRVAFQNTTTTAEILSKNIELNYSSDYDMIISMVLKKDRYKHLKHKNIIGKRRIAEMVEARHLAIYLCHKVLRKPSVSTGLAFGGRDHSTVLHACGRITDALECIESGFGKDLVYLKKIIDSIVDKLKLYNVI